MRKITFFLLFFIGCVIDVPEAQFHETEFEQEESDGDEDSSSFISQLAAFPEEEEKLDVGSRPNDGAGDSTSALDCHKMDFLFIIDNSGSMGDKQDQLVANFSTFVNVILTYPLLEDFQVGVITTDRNKYNIEECQVMGGLVAQTGGGNSSGSTCVPYSSEKNFMTQEDNLLEKFSCAADVGTYGDGNEKPIEALIEASDLWIRQPENCNEGFLRDDALMVVVFITDEDQPLSSLYEPAQVTEALQEFKDHFLWLKGPEKDIVMLGLVSTPDCEKITNYRSPHIIEFIEMFQYGMTAGICESSFEEFFLDALGQISLSCNEGYEPEP